MNFKTNFTLVFFFRIGLILFLLFWAWLKYTSDIHRNGFWKYDYLVILFTASLWFIQFYRSIFALLFGKIIFSVNEVFIYDFINDVKYDWKDIKEIYEYNGTMFIDLYNPKEYIDKIGNRRARRIIRWWFKPGRKRSLFNVNLDLIDDKGENLLEIIDNYSIQSVENSTLSEE